MPEWDFRCMVCGDVVTRSYPSFTQIAPPRCLHCQADMERLPAAGTFVLKGAGFHKNDYPSTAK